MATKIIPVLDNKSLMIKRASAKHVKNKTWPVEKRIEVVTKWLALGNLKLVAELTGVSYAVCNNWKMQPWWNDMVGEIKASRAAQVDSKLSRIIDKSLEMIEDRLENGTPEFNNKTGEIVRRPANIKEITGVTQTLMTQQLQQAKALKDDEVKTEQVTIKDQIAMLAAEFAKFNTKRTVEEITSALHEKRETRLQEGSSTLYLEAGSGEEEDGTERSETGDDETGEGA